MKRILSLIALTTLVLVGIASPNPRSSQRAGGWNSPRQRVKPYVILVSFDGFRADYLDLFDPPNFRRLAQNGVRADDLVSVFPSKTFPNHISIVTGLYADRHGIVSNSFYDPFRRQTYAMADRPAVQDGTWYFGEPIWVSAEKQGMVSAANFWPGSEAAIGGIRPSYWRQYDGQTANESRVDSVLEWLRFPPQRRPHFLTLYFSDVDSAGHRFGPATPQVRGAVEEVDRQLGRLLDGIETLEIRDQIYVILVADHGMTESGPDRYVAIEKLIDPGRFKLSDGGAVASLQVMGGLSEASALRDELNAKLEHGRAYLRSEIPADLHYRRSPRIGDVVVIMDEHYQIGAGDRAPTEAGGSHGWPPNLKSMRGIFLAKGPSLKKGARIGSVRNIDIYSFMSEMLGLKAARGIDGRPGYLSALCEEPRHTSSKPRKSTR